MNLVSSGGVGGGGGGGGAAMPERRTFTDRCSGLCSAIRDGLPAVGQFLEGSGVVRWRPVGRQRPVLRDSGQGTAAQ